MTRAVCVGALLFFLLPFAAMADGIDLTNQYGSVTILTSGITSRQSELKSFGGITASAGHALGRVYFSTGALISGSLWAGGTFSSIGSVFDILGVGSKMKTLAGQNVKGNVGIFSGTFVGPIEWTLVASSKFFREYQLSGQIQGMLWNGRMVSGTTQQIIDTHWNKGTIDSNMGSIRMGITHISSTPEPGSWGLFSLGLLTMTDLIRRRLSTT
jgi:hypothetical protein